MSEVFDVVVVGSGAGGAAAAMALTQAGASVALVEAGPRYDPFEDYHLMRSDWEAQRFPEKVPTAGRQTFAPMQRLDPAHDELRSWNAQTGRYVKGEERAVWAYHHVVGYGGSTLQFTGEAHRLNPRSMRLRSEFGAGADWPLSYAELEPFYEVAEAVMGVAGPDVDPHAPRARPYPLTAHPLAFASATLARGFSRLGLSLVANARAAPSRPYDDRPSCNYCGGCQRGCTRLDKGSADLTFLRRAEDSGRLRTFLETQAVRIVAGPGDRVRGVEAARADGAGEFIAGRAVVAACGAVETPRLLLASDGLANEHGEVGRHFMETIAFAVAALHPDPLGSHRGLPADAICWDRNDPDAIPGAVGGCRFTSGVHEADLAGPLAYATRVVGGFGREHRRRMREQFGRAVVVGAVGENLPNPRAFVDLDPTARDRFGMPLARIHAHLEEMDAVRLKFMAGACRAALDASGAGPEFEAYGTYDAFSATHVFGGCRMGETPANSVVDRFGRAWRWRNLFVADASVFPSTGGGESPALTISALALRTAGHIMASARRGAL